MAVARLLPHSRRRFQGLAKKRTTEKVSVDRDCELEVDLSPSQYNWGGSVALRPSVSIFSKKLRQWQKLNTPILKPNGLIFYSSLLDFTRREAHEWNLGGANYRSTIEDVVQMFQSLVLPVFALFEHMEDAVVSLLATEAQFYPGMGKTLSPLSFMLCFATHAKAEQFFNDTVNSFSYQKRFDALYQELKTLPREEINVMHHEFIGAGEAKLTFLHGLNRHPAS